MTGEFKETPIGKIPKEWNVFELKEIANVKYGKAIPKKGGEIPVIGSSGIYAWTDRPLVEFPTLVIGRKGTAGAVHLVEVPSWPSDTTFYLEFKKDIDIKYLYYHMSFFKLSGTHAQTTLPSLKREFLEHYYVIYPPPLPEQKKIAEILSTIDKAIEKTDALIHHYQQLKNALMQRLFTEGIGHTKFKPSPLGQIPAEWDVVKIGDIIEFAQYGLSIKMYDEGQYPIVKMDSIINGKVMPVNLKYVDLDEETFNKFKLEKGDILVNRTNSYELVGKTGIFMLEGDYVFASYLIRLRPKKDIVDSAFLTYYLILSQDRLRQIATRGGVSQANINATNLKKFLVPLPPLDEQKKIAQILMTIDNKIEAEIKTKEELEKLKLGMMDKLLTGKVRVKVGEKSG